MSKGKLSQTIRIPKSYPCIQQINVPIDVEKITTSRAEIVRCPEIHDFLIEFLTNFPKESEERYIAICFDCNYKPPFNSLPPVIITLNNNSVYDDPYFVFLEQKRLST